MSLKNFLLNQLQDLSFIWQNKARKMEKEQLHALSNLLDNHQKKS